MLLCKEMTIVVVPKEEKNDSFLLFGHTEKHIRLVANCFNYCVKLFARDFYYNFVVCPLQTTGKHDRTLIEVDIKSMDKICSCSKI